MDRFKSCGKVRYADLWQTADGRSCGAGTVDFECSDAAQRAAKRMDGTKLFGAKIGVSKSATPEQLAMLCVHLDRKERNLTKATRPQPRSRRQPP
jgi:RNA recognition motif-containing protein